MKHDHMPKEAHVEEPAQAQGGTPNPSGEIPIGSRQIFRSPAPPLLQHCNAVTLLGQAKRETLPPKPEPITTKSNSPGVVTNALLAKDFYWR
jgi:hypothetical protein